MICRIRIALIAVVSILNGCTHAINTKSIIAGGASAHTALKMSTMSMTPKWMIGGKSSEPVNDELTGGPDAAKEGDEA